MEEQTPQPPQEEEVQEGDKAITTLPSFPTEEHLLKMKMKLGIQEGDKSHDALLNLTYYEALEEARDYCNYEANDVLPEGVLRVAVDMAIEKYRSNSYGNANGLMQVTSLKRGDVSTTFERVEAYTTVSYLDQLKKYRKLRW